MTITSTETVTDDVHTDDALAYARTIHHGLSPRERRALAAVYEEMPCSVSTVARAATVSRRTAQRACEALEGDELRLIQRTGAGLIIHPDAIGAVDAWAHRHGGRADVVDWWESPEPTPVVDGRSYPQGGDPEPWPGDVFPEPTSGEDVGLALRAVESRRAPLGRGTFLPFPVMNYASATSSIQAVKVAVECGRRATRSGVAEFERGELARITGLSSQQVSNTLARMRRDGIATSATAARVELDLLRG